VASMSLKVRHIQGSRIKQTWGTTCLEVDIFYSDFAHFVPRWLETQEFFLFSVSEMTMSH
jgi:hypothetical protein